MEVDRGRQEDLVNVCEGRWAYKKSLDKLHLFFFVSLYLYKMFLFDYKIIYYKEQI